MSTTTYFRRVYQISCKIFTFMYGQQMKNPISEERKLIYSLRDSHPDEVAMYDFIMNHYSAGYIMYMVVSFALALHHAIMPVTVFMLLDFKEPEKNLKFVNSTSWSDNHSGPLLIEFLCMTTNCSRLSENEPDIASDFLNLNYFPICFPSLAKASPFFHSYDNLPLSKYVHMITSILLFLTGVVFILLQTYLNSSPCWCPLYMFQAAPNVSEQLALLNLEIIHNEYISSLINYKSMLVEEEKKKKFAEFTGLTPRKKEFKTELKSLQTELAQVRGIRSISFEECLSIVHTGKWSDMNVQNVTKVIYVILFMTCFYTFVMPLVPFEYLTMLHNDRLTDIKAYMQQSGCKLWLTQQHTTTMPQQPPTYIDPMRNDIPFNLFNVSFLLCYMFTYFAMGLLGVVMVYSIISELNLRLIELEFVVLVANEMLRLIECTGSFQLDLERVKSHSSLFTQLRGKIIKSKKINILGGASTSISAILSAQSSEAETRLALQRVALELLHEEGPNSCLDLNEKIYLNFREFLLTVKTHNPIVGPVLSVLQLILYSFAVLTVYLSKTVRNFESVSTFMVGSTITVMVCLVYVAASIHSNSKRLFQALETLLARTAHLEDPTMRHLRVLWLKSMNVVSREGGIYFKSLGARIVHGFILKITLVTSTLVILALK